MCSDNLILEYQLDNIEKINIILEYTGNGWWVVDGWGTVDVSLSYLVLGIGHPGAPDLSSRRRSTAEGVAVVLVCIQYTKTCSSSAN